MNNNAGQRMFTATMTRFSLLLVTSIFVHQIFTDEVPCSSRQYDQDSIVCVCNATYCDYAGIEGGGLLYTYFNAFVTTKDGLRLDRQLGTFDDQIQPNKYVFNLGNDTRQTILGFGAAFTDAATMTMNTLSPQARANLINSYYGQNGIEYTMGRIPMASCDFSKRVYSYDDVEGDLDLKEFALSEEDLLYKIPAIKDAMKVSKRKVTLFASPWSSPYWMKTNNNMSGMGTINGAIDGEYYKAWANYFVKFLQGYKQLGLDMWGITAQNEPSDGNIDDFPYQCLGFDPETQRNFIASDLGPALETNGFGGVKLMILDDQRSFLPSWPDVVLKDPFAAKYVSGIAVHWNEDMVVPPTAMSDTYKQFGQDYFILNTEAFVQDLVNKSNTVLLGNWQRGERYFTNILQDIEQGVSGWVDWNMALDMQGGPSWQGNLADSPVIVNAQTGEFYKQPMFYAMGHFSKFVRPGSKVISHSTNLAADSDLKAIFFTREDDSIAANFVNTNDTESFDITITDYRVPGYLNYEIPPKTFVTFIWYRI